VLNLGQVWVVVSRIVAQRVFMLRYGAVASPRASAREMPAAVGSEQAFLTAIEFHFKPRIVPI
jgi:hypothetical protein